jgi:proline dehydrogenase
LVVAATIDGTARAEVVRTARTLLADLRQVQADGWVNQFLQEYRLGTEEGTALLSLAEAFLRVPDPQTADLLIADKLTEAEWSNHKGQSSSLLVNSATWGLVLGKAVDKMIAKNKINVNDDGEVLKQLYMELTKPQTVELFRELPTWHPDALVP